MGFYCFLRSFVVQWPVSVRLRTIRPQATAYIAKIIWYLSAMQLFLQCIRINRKLLLSMLTSAFFFVWSRWITKSAKVKQNAVKQIWREICTQRLELSYCMKIILLQRKLHILRFANSLQKLRLENLQLLLGQSKGIAPFPRVELSEKVCSGGFAPCSCSSCNRLSSQGRNMTSSAGGIIVVSAFL